MTIVIPKLLIYAAIAYTVLAAIGTAVLFFSDEDA